jgi:acetyl esterase/lipase
MLIPMLCALVVGGALPPPLHPEMQAILKAYEAFDFDALIAGSPEAAQAMINGHVPPPSNIGIEEVRDIVIPGTEASIPARLYHPAPDVRLPLVVYFHGGGWTWGTLDMYEPDVRFMAVEAGVAVLSVDYRVAPQHVFPAAVTDCIDATIWAAANGDALNIDPTRMAVAGDSAGGNLAAVTANVLRQRGHTPKLQAQMLLFPVLDATGTHASMTTLATGYGLESRQMPWFYDVYDPGGTNRTDHSLSPMCLRDFSNLPHAIVMPAQLDPLRDEAIAYAACLARAGTPVDLLVAEGMIHGFTSFWMKSPAAAEAYRVGLDRLAAVLHGPGIDAIDLLDLNGDGILQPLEAADALQRMEEDGQGEPVAVGELLMSARLDPALLRLEGDEWFADLDADGDGQVQLAEVDEDIAPLLSMLDDDLSGALSRAEFEPILHSNRDIFIDMEIAWIMDEFDVDDDGRISVDEAQDDIELHEDADADGDGFVTPDELAAMFAEEDTVFDMEVNGDTAECFGTIGPTTPARIMRLLLEHPQVKTLVLVDVPGSMDDDSSLRACRLIRHHGLNTHVPADGEIASGGVDMFCAGAQRTVESGAMLGVHSWGGAGESGDTVPRDHEGHQMYLDYGREMGLPDAFYWFTIDSASPQDIHWMTRKEMEQYGLLRAAPAQAHPPAAPTPPALPTVSQLQFDIELIPESKRRLRRAGFTKQTAVIAPNGKPIRIVAQPGVRDIAVARARNLLKFFLTDVPGSTYGANKAAVANAMADNRAMLMMPEGEHREGREPRIEAQPLYEDETPVDGSRWYMESDWNHRDAGFEEIFHLVHDAGIGTDRPGALPSYQRALEAEARASIIDGRWGIPIDPHVKDWIEELDAEGSLAQEYIASVIDSYYGLWAAFDEAPGGMWGIYCAKTRDELDTKDPRGRALLESFLPPMLHGYEALIDPDFEGEFSLVFDPAQPYTHKSRYYVDVTLTGAKGSALRGNAEDNVLRGNAGDNTLHGGDGQDTAVFAGPAAQYRITSNGDAVIVVDSVAGRDGTDRLMSIEVLRFADGPRKGV